MTRNQHFTAIVFLGCCSAFAANVFSQDAAARQQLDNLFTVALTAERASYFTVRREITMNQGATAFLSEICTNEDLYSRVLANSMLVWATNATVNVNRDHLLGKAIAEMERRRGGMRLLVKLRTDAVLPCDALHDKVAVPYLLEIVLKGCEQAQTNNGVRVISGYPFALWMQCYAAALVGGYGGADVTAVLSAILDSNGPEPLRACAATGLRRSKAPTAVEPLIEALSDTSEVVRGSASVGLQELTGEDFGTDRVKYHEWWQENKARLLSAKGKRF